MKRIGLSDLWEETAPSKDLFQPQGMPPFLAHSLAPGAPLASAVWLKMHGSIRLNGWKSFRAEEVLHQERGFVWKARVGVISGRDALIDGDAGMRWKLLGLWPVMTASGPDIVRSAIGRWIAEAIWLPTMLLPEHGTLWKDSSATLSRFGQMDTLQMKLDGQGRLKEFAMQRWGNPDSPTFGLHPFGGIVEEERVFEGYTIPSRLRIGWHFGTPRWEKGEFFRVEIDEARFR
jgi:hypothetical protein